jgi:hypothetical protein
MCLVCGCEEAGRPRRQLVLRHPGHPEPDELVLEATEESLARAESWIGWSSGALMAMGNAWTPHKALRRIADHLVDHLCQIEARSAGETPVPDMWKGRSVTLDTDWARFSEQDLDEATARIRRLAQVMAWRLRALQKEWDSGEEEDWTIRNIAEHLAEASVTYAQQPPATAVLAPSK